MKNRAEDILKAVNEHIRTIECGGAKRYRIDDVYEDLGIFDWWNEYLSLHQLKDMQKFLREAIKLGYTGYVCFKVGAVGCANGMWAHKKDTVDGYSPDGEVLYKSFVSSYNYWNAKRADGTWIADNEHYNEIKTMKELEARLEALTEEVQ